MRLVVVLEYQSVPVWIIELYCSVQTSVTAVVDWNSLVTTLHAVVLLCFAKVTPKGRNTQDFDTLSIRGNNIRYAHYTFTSQFISRQLGICVLHISNIDAVLLLRTASMVGVCCAVAVTLSNCCLWQTLYTYTTISADIT